MESVELPCIDLSEKNTTYLSSELLDVCKDWGIFTVKNHGIPIEEIDYIFRISDELFESPTQEKQSLLLKEDRLHSEFTGHFCEESDVKHQHKRFLKDSSEDILRLLNYSIPEGVELQDYDENAGAHSNYGSITLLFQKDKGGLEVRPPYPHVVADWVTVSLEKGTVLINIADILQFWTSGQLKSTVHRVKLDPKMKTRRKIAYFVAPDANTSLVPLFDENMEVTGDSKRRLSKHKKVRSHLWLWRASQDKV
ncbi:iron/ascorbate oxidoreductase family [Schizosaccharomyces cryophilus OY26]|uniref:Iron/ascorbate oxidoreductase family n=1 Tax=Schizosaccharomyces cryophilus (strain OY26 / ATCC MYA-4695 / CBS 11777 / NBRC 106824 / NRRL Y48691) TaxID=653667 RepID=S9X7K9_SCHCR|nr:iron/ascorbate oxidoreductase family [Schizosaccharomyces cryophilus OY26]EPY53087.1 iron/ascorbate oxidoreductase family [Schizosaccharomyces cryophilus OY26]